MPILKLPTLSPTSTPKLTPHILLYTLGNHPYPKTKHSLPQYLINPLLSYFNLGKEGDVMRLERKFDCWIGSGVVRSGPEPGVGGVRTKEGEEGEFRLTVVKPRLLMNISGRPLPFILRTLPNLYPQSAPPTLIALADNLTLPPLSIGKLRYGVSHQGHGGLKSVEASLGGDGFWRLGLGIGRGGESGPGAGVVGWVMSDLSRDEKGFWEGQGAAEVGEVLGEMARRLGRGEVGNKAGVGGGSPKKQKKERVRGSGGSTTTG